MGKYLYICMSVCNSVKVTIVADLLNGINICDRYAAVIVTSGTLLNTNFVKFMRANATLVT